MSAAENDRAEEARGARILLVDDDAGIREVVSAFLESHGFVVEAVPDGRGMDLALSREPADLVVLDLMMPGEDGLSLCRKLARPGGPGLIIFSALGEETDRIVGFEVGADQYVRKPCSPYELLARIRAVLRRRPNPKPDDAEGATFEFSGWRLNVDRHELRAPDGGLVDLPTLDFALLRVFVERPQRVLNRRQLLELGGGADLEAPERVIDTRISRLRRRLARDGDELIGTVRSEGYVFTPSVTRSA